MIDSGSMCKCGNENFKATDSFLPKNCTDQLAASSSSNETQNQRTRDRDGYKTFVRRLSEIDPKYEMKNVVKGTEFQNLRRSSVGVPVVPYLGQSLQLLETSDNVESNRSDNANMAQVDLSKHFQQIDNGNYDESINNKKKREIFKKIMSANNVKQDSRILAGKIMKSKSKKQGSRKTIKKPKQNKRRLSDEEEIQEFLKNATLAQLQKYFNSTPSKLNTQPGDIETNSYLRLSRLERDFERIKSLRGENFSLVFKINRIQRTKGEIDNINECVQPQSKYKALIQKIKKCEKENLEIYKRLEKTTPVLPTHQQLKKRWLKNLEDMRFRSKYQLTLPGLVNNKIVDESDDNRPKVFLDFTLKDGNALGRVIFSLFIDLVPKTVMNFIALCENFKQNINENRKSNEIYPHLAGSPLHRIFPDLYIEGGDIINGRGCCGRAASGDDFFPENLNIPHDFGTISMTPTEDGRVNSLFAISFRRIDLLNGKRPVFGKTIKGMKVLKMIEGFGTKNGRPKEKIIITKCGLLSLGSEQSK